jgi:hypothetical protein
MKATHLLIYLILCLLSTTSGQAEDEIKLETITIRGNKELPKILYIVPWQDGKNIEKQEQQLVLHSLFGDLFDPIIPDSHNQL